MSFIKQGKSTRGKRGRPFLPIEKTYESKKVRGPTAPISNVSSRTDHMTIFLFILKSRDGVENLIAMAIHLFSVRNVMLGYASQDLSIVLKNSMIRKHLFHIYQ